MPSDRALLRQLVSDCHYYLMPAHFFNLVAYDKPCSLLRDAKSQVPARARVLARRWAAALDGTQRL